MNGKDIFLGLRYVGEDLIEKAEYGQFSANGEKQEKTHGRIRRPLLLAALIALLLMLVGCGIAYVLHLQDLKIGVQTVPQTQYDDSGSRIDETEVELDVLSMQGIKGSPNYLANQEWLAFTNSYTPAGGEYWESAPEY